MATVIWNTTNIPLNWQAQGYKENIGDRVLRTEVEDGPDKVRLLGTGKTRTIEGRGQKCLEEQGGDIWRL